MFAVFSFLARHDPIVMGTQKATGAPMMWEAQCAAHAFVTYLAYNAHNEAGGDEAKKK